MVKPINDENGRRVGFENYKWVSSREIAKVYIDMDELWPCYIPKTTSNHALAVTAEVPIEVYERWERVMREFDEVQKEMKEYWNMEDDRR